jgi:WD40 repeat protein
LFQVKDGERTGRIIHVRLVTSPLAFCSKDWRKSTLAENSEKDENMKVDRALSLFVVGGVMLLLRSEPRNFAQDRPAQPPLTKTVSTAPKLADFSANGEIVVFATQDGRIRFGRSGDLVTLRTVYMCQPEAVALSPDGRLLATAGNFNGCFSKIKVWNVEDGSLVCAFETEIGSQSRLKFSANSQYLAAVTDGVRVDLWQLPDGRFKWFETLPKEVVHIAFGQQDGGTLLVLCEDGIGRRFSLP